MKARDNPLATHRVLAVRYRPLDMTWSQLLTRLEALNYCAAIVGPKGSGKTTLIEDLAPHLAARGFTPRLVYLTEEQRAIDPADLRSLTSRDIMLIDGAEQLDRFRWWYFLTKTRRARGIVVTQHRPGRLPTLLETTTTPRLLHDIARELLGAAAPDSRRIDHLYARHRGNLREALRELYDEFSVTSSPVAL